MRFDIETGWIWSGMMRRINAARMAYHSEIIQNRKGKSIQGGGGDSGADPARLNRPMGEEAASSSHHSEPKRREKKESRTLAKSFSCAPLLTAGTLSSWSVSPRKTLCPHHQTLIIKRNFVQSQQNDADRSQPIDGPSLLHGLSVSRYLRNNSFLVLRLSIKERECRAPERILSFFQSRYGAEIPLNRRAGAVTSAVVDGSWQPPFCLTSRAGPRASHSRTRKEPFWLRHYAIVPVESAHPSGRE